MAGAKFLEFARFSRHFRVLIFRARSFPVVCAAQQMRDFCRNLQHPEPPRRGGFETQNAGWWFKWKRLDMMRGLAT
jgi:hypothetical protein